MCRQNMDKLNKKAKWLVLNLYFFNSLCNCLIFLFNYLNGIGCFKMFLPIDLKVIKHLK